MGRVSISDILYLLGEGGLEDRYDEQKVRFRRFLTRDKWQPGDFAAWAEECLERSSPTRPSYYHAFQDLCVAVGAHMGMDVEFGLYSRSQDIGFDGKWEGARHGVILLEVKASPWPVPSVHQLGSYMDRYSVRFNLQPQEVFGLFVTGPGDCLPLVDQIKGSEYRTRMKLVQVADLIRMWELQARLEEQMPRKRARTMVQGLLMPFESVNVGSLLDIVYEVASRTEQAQEDGGGSGEEWLKSELVDALDKISGARLAVTIALCLAGPQPRPSSYIVELMKRVAEHVPKVPKPNAISSRVFNGTMAAFARARTDRGKEAFIVGGGAKGYRLAPKYRDWVMEWAENRGLLRPLRDDQQRLFMPSPEPKAEGEDEEDGG